MHFYSGPPKQFLSGVDNLRTLLIQAAKVLLMRPHNWARYSFGRSSGSNLASTLASTRINSYH
jgi:hypothetical protein